MDVIKILETLNRYRYVKLNKPMGDWYSVCCPFHDERRPSCGVSLHTQIRGGNTYPEGFWHCFSCGAAYSMEDGVTQILKNHNVSQSGREWLIEHVDGYEVDPEFDYLISQDLMDILDAKYATKQIQDLSKQSVSYISETELASYRYVVPYMYERRLTDEIIERYDVGYDANWIPPGRKNPMPCITFPVRNTAGKTLFLCRRSIQGKFFHYPKDVQKPVYGLFELPEDTKSVVICESCINALTVTSYGYPAVALLGTGDSYQIQQLKELGVNEFVLCLDGDPAGRSGTEKLKRSLKSVAMIWTITMPDGKDANNFSKEEFDSLYAERQ